MESGALAERPSDDMAVHDGGPLPDDPLGTVEGAVEPFAEEKSVSAILDGPKHKSQQISDHVLKNLKVQEIESELMRQLRADVCGRPGKTYLKFLLPDWLRWAVIIERSVWREISVSNAAAAIRRGSRTSTGNSGLIPRHIIACDYMEFCPSH